jgi:hypothetical protein
VTPRKGNHLQPDSFGFRPDQLPMNAPCGNRRDTMADCGQTHARKLLMCFRSRAKVGQGPDQQTVWKTCGKLARSGSKTVNMR